MQDCRLCGSSELERTAVRLQSNEEKWEGRKSYVENVLLRIWMCKKGERNILLPFPMRSRRIFVCILR